MKYLYIDLTVPFVEGLTLSKASPQCSDKLEHKFNVSLLCRLVVLILYFRPTSEDSSLISGSNLILHFLSVSQMEIYLPSIQLV